MAVESRDTFFAQYSTPIKQINPMDSPLPFKDHPSFPLLMDILGRKQQHHALLCADFSATLHPLFFNALQHHLANTLAPPSLRQADFIYLQLENTQLSEIKQIPIEKEFEALRESLATRDQYLIIAFSRIDIFTKEPKKADERFLRRQIDLFLAHPKCRCLLITTPQDYAPYLYLEDLFTCVRIAEPSQADKMAILNQHRHELESFHHLSIPDTLLPLALSLAERYLSTNRPLEKALQLLDSSAARASTHNTSTLTNTLLLNVLSDWTNIPPTHLQINAFKHSDFIHHLQQQIFGQDTAITILGHELLQAQAHLQQKPGPFSSFLFAGPEHTGKKTTALALTEQLFKQHHLMYIAHSPITTHTLSDIKLQRYQDHAFLPITEVIRQTPYAVILFENADKLSADALNGLQEILSTGYLHDIHGNQHNFRQAIIILSTTIGAQRLSTFAESIIPDEDIYTMDLMQLVMNDTKQNIRPAMHPHSSQEITESILPDITAAFPLSLCQHLHLVPFLPLNKTAIEKIMRHQLRLLGKELQNLHGLELGYAPEVIRFLTTNVLMKRELINQQINSNNALKQLYFCVEQAILNQPGHANHSNQLFLQLNETGHSLRCDWLATPAREHA